MPTFRTDNRAEWRLRLAEHFETEKEILFRKAKANQLIKGYGGIEKYHK